MGFSLYIKLALAFTLLLAVHFSLTCCYSSCYLARQAHRQQTCQASSLGKPFRQTPFHCRTHVFSNLHRRAGTNSDPLREAVDWASCQLDILIYQMYQGAAWCDAVLKYLWELSRTQKDINVLAFFLFSLFQCCIWC